MFRFAKYYTSNYNSMQRTGHEQMMNKTSSLILKKLLHIKIRLICSSTIYWFIYRF